MVTKAVAKPLQVAFRLATGPMFRNVVNVTRFIHALVAVLAGNAAYFLLMPHLPPSARHQPLRLDVGLVVDFCFCLAVFGVVKMFANKPSNDS
jgi:hypothetical protein